MCDKEICKVIMGLWNVNRVPRNVIMGTCNVIMRPWNMNRGLWNVIRGSVK